MKEYTFIVDGKKVKIKLRYPNDAKHIVGCIGIYNLNKLIKKQRR